MPSNASTVITFHPASFEGGWKTDVQFMDVMGSPYVLAHGLGRRVLDSSATAEVPQSGEYYVWVRTRTWVDAGNYTPAPSAFRVSVGGTELSMTFGLGGSEWHWENGGVVKLDKGPVTVVLKDLSGFDARCAGVVLTDGVERPNGALDLTANPVAENVECDLVVAGGGVPGTCAALSAARSGLKVALVQDRPVLGGNASSEIRVWCAGEISNDIVREVRNRFMNMEHESSMCDEWRQRLVDDEPNILCRTCHRLFAAETDGNRIVAVKALDWKHGRVVRFSAPLFVDATGDGWLGFFAGAEFRMGRESSSEFDESMAPEKADDDTLGSSLMWTSARAGNDEPFSAPWAEPWAQGEQAINGEWNWEYGIHRDIIGEGEWIRDRLLLAIYGAFSNAKKNPDNCRRVLNFLPYLLGKRESRRLVGEYVYSEKDVTEKRQFEDAISRGSWSVDLHYDDCKEGVDFLTTCRQPHYGRYWIPFRSCVSNNISNLMMAGRCFSCTHVGLAGPRVINTLAMMGVACGYAASLCKDKSISPKEVYSNGFVREIQRKMGGDWPGNPDPATADWMIVDDEDFDLPEGWGRNYCCNGCTVNDKYSSCRAGDPAVGILEMKFPIVKKGRYLLKRNIPFLPEWWRNAHGGMTAAEIITDGKTISVQFPAFAGVGTWTDIGEFELCPGAEIHIIPEKSTGTVFIDAFALVK